QRVEPPTPTGPRPFASGRFGRDGLEPLGGHRQRISEGSRFLRIEQRGRVRPEFAAVNPELNARVLEHKLHRNWMTGPRDCFHVDLLSVWFASRLPEQNRNETAAFRNGAMRDWGGGAPRD